MMILNGMGMAGFVMSLQNTTIANVTVIYATLPFLTARLRLALVPGARASAHVDRQPDRGRRRRYLRPWRATRSAAADSLLGDLSALGFTTAFALMTVLMRRHREAPMLKSLAISGFLMALVALCIRDPFTISFPGVGTGWLAAFGIVDAGGGLGLYTIGARRLPAAQAALLSASEVPMAPLWVWIFFSEVPARETFIGGGLVLAAVLWNVGAELRKTNEALFPALTPIVGESQKTEVK